MDNTLVTINHQTEITPFLQGLLAQSKLKLGKNAMIKPTETGTITKSMRLSQTSSHGKYKNYASVLIGIHREKQSPENHQTNLPYQLSQSQPSKLGLQ